MKKSFLACALISLPALSMDLASVSASISKNLATLDLSVVSVSESAVSGIYEVNTGSSIIHVSEDGQYVFSGDLFQFTNSGIENLSATKRGKLTLNEVYNEKLDPIKYPAPNERYEITVFTDSSCSYCQKLHADMQGYNDLGITIRYLAFPRGGLNSPAYSDMVSVWCSDNRNEAMDRIKGGGSIAAIDCDNQINLQYELGVKLGVQGTPAVIMPNGKLVPGYAPPQKVLSMIKQNL
ncbi:bifunctional protein-disulfide isomerase/oxidoreductase DsbC [Motilimonas eburnea]|uniref:bifunctional protein-disulfide isomerase/oxidoreductase DsbC n=1 Tax=Motilimonas eburnea TaxID=1737488 RepID=UPI001E3DD471|nr:bifunctional protein-disulfide isomerase/oxidoreductase DsbC [Motilimonas eburnea]MCE2571789.1 bifunctional protein-disulfide isomerase/oxidoreductase DsbC [Motilimonas eburnea]